MWSREKGKETVVKRLVCRTIVVGLLAAGCVAPALAEEPVALSATPQGVRVLSPTRTVEAPKMDGVLDDACWKQAQEVTGFRGYANMGHAAYGPDYFRTMNLDKEVAPQSFAYVCYDDAHLYVGIRCVLGEGQGKPNDPASVAGDRLSVMLDPGHTQSAYREFDAKSYGPAQGGAGKLHVGEGFYSVEMAVPFHTLGIAPEVGATWGINITRQTTAPASSVFT